MRKAEPQRNANYTTTSSATTNQPSSAALQGNQLINKCLTAPAGICCTLNAQDTLQKPLQKRRVLCMKTQPGPDTHAVGILP